MSNLQNFLDLTMPEPITVQVCLNCSSLNPLREQLCAPSLHCNATMKPITQNTTHLQMYVRVQCTSDLKKDLSGLMVIIIDKW